MRKTRILLLLIVLLLTVQAFAEWRMNPFTGKLDYYEPSAPGSSKDNYYVTTRAATDLTNEVNLGALQTGLVKCTVSGGECTISIDQNTYLTALPSTTCTNQYISAIATTGAGTCSSWPTFNQNTTGTASNLSGTPQLPNGTTATTQSQGDNSQKLATTAYTDLATRYKVPVTSHKVVVLASVYGCASGWQSGALASEILEYTNAGVNSSYILCYDVSPGPSIMPSSLLLTMAVGNPTVQGTQTGGDALLLPSGLLVNMYTGTPIVAGQRNQGISPTGIYMTASIGTPTVSTTGNAFVNPSTMVLNTAVGTPTYGAGSGLSPTGIYVTASIGTPTVEGGAGATAVSDNFNRTDTYYDWLSSVSYANNATAKYNSSLWYSLQGSNMNNTPTEGAYWSANPPTWSSGTTYAANYWVIYSSVVYRSLQASNFNHQPDTSPTWWSAETPVYGLGSNWTKMYGVDDALRISSNTATAPVSTRTSGMYWSANTFNSNQYSEGNLGTNVAVRIQSGALTLYYMTEEMVDEGDGYMTAFYKLMKVVNGGTPAQIGSTWGFDSGGAGLSWTDQTTPDHIFRIEANGTTITLKTATTHGGSLTTRITATDSDISGGAAGIYHLPNYNSTTTDNWYGGDL